MDAKFADLLGVLHDAHIIYRKNKGIYGFELEQKNRDYINYIVKIIHEIFDIKPKVETRNRSWGTYYRIRVHSKSVYEKIIKYNFKYLLINSPSKIKKALISGLFDAEGSVSSNEVRIFNKDTNLLKISKRVIESFNINCGKIVITSGDVWQVPIYAKADKNRFMDIFKPKHPKKLVSF